MGVSFSRAEDADCVADERLVVDVLFRLLFDVVPVVRLLVEEVVPPVVFFVVAIYSFFFSVTLTSGRPRSLLRSLPDNSKLINHNSPLGSGHA
jgi:hypothetical protein